MLWTCACGAVNAKTHRVCELCGADRKAAVDTRLAPVSRHCPHDGAALGQDGFCPRGGGYPHAMSCPFKCPPCRALLDWSGGCFTCYGTRTGRREEWSFLGEGYYTHMPNGSPIGDGQHWVQQEPAGRPAVSPAANAAHKHRVVKLLTPLLARGAAPKPEEKR